MIVYRFIAIRVKIYQGRTEMRSIFKTGSRLWAVLFVLLTAVSAAGAAGCGVLEDTFGGRKTFIGAEQKQDGQSEKKRAEQDEEQRSEHDEGQQTGKGVKRRTKKDGISDSYRIEGFPEIFQNPELPTGCEITALAMALGYYGFDADKTVLASDYLPREEYEVRQGEDGLMYGSDLNEYFLGDPFTEEGYV